METNDVPVTIVGGGPVGLSMALALARQGVRSLVIEQGATTTAHPKARGVWPRAMEIFRQWGVEQPIRARGLADGSDTFVVLDGLENELGRTLSEEPHNQILARKSMVAQDAVEEALVAKLEDYPAAEILWYHRVISGEADDAGAVVIVENLATGQKRSWRSDYLIGADGGAGFTAKLAGIPYEGPPHLGLMLNTYFRADLSDVNAAANAAILVLIPEGEADESYRLLNDEEPYRLLNTNGSDRWLLLERIGIETDERPRPLTEEENVRRLRGILRRPNLDIEIINEGIWRLTRRIAANFSKGRVFLVGDAAHRFPPTGGHGMNSGICDVHNLAWKLAFVLNGSASPSLLDSYDVERRPIANSNADISRSNHKRFRSFLGAVLSRNRDRLQFWLRDMDNHIHSIGQVLGSRYEDGALISDGTTPPPFTPRTYTPSDRPGGRFPHFWLDPERSRSSLDLFDRDLVLIVGKSGDGWADAAEEVSRRRGLPIAVHRLGDVDPVLGIAMGANGAALVRPDGIIAWRIGWAEPDPVGMLDAIVEQIVH